MNLNSLFPDLNLTTELNLNDIRDLYKHKWIRINGEEIYVKYIYENFYNTIDWMDYVFIGRDRDNNYIKISIPKTDNIEKLILII